MRQKAGVVVIRYSRISNKFSYQENHEWNKINTKQHMHVRPILKHGLHDNHWRGPLGRFSLPLKTQGPKTLGIAENSGGCSWETTPDDEEEVQPDTC